MADPRAQFVISAKDQASAVVKKLSSELGSATGFALKLGATLGAGFTLRGLVDTIRQSEVLSASLKTATGSADAAAIEFAKLQKFAQETPFALEQSVSAFIKLKNLGLDPSIEALRSYGNTASAMGKDLNQFIEAVADAATFQFERLRDFGITAKQQGDQVSLTFRGVTTTVRKSADDIVGYLRKIGEVEFGGAMEERSRTLDGALSNLGDTFGNIARQIGNSGLTELLDAAARKMIEFGEVASNTITALRGKFDVPIDTKNVDLVTAKLADLYSDLEELDARERNTSEPLDIFGLKFVVKGNQERIAQIAAQRDEVIAEIQQFEELRKTLQQAQREAPAFVAPTRTTEAETKKKTGKSEAEKEAERFASALQKLQDELDPLAAKTREYLESVALLDRAWSEGKISAEQYESLMLSLATDVDALREAEEALAKDRERAGELIKGLDPGASIRDQIFEVQRLRDAFPELSDALADVELELQTKWDKIGDDAKDAADKTKTAWEELGPTFASAFEDAVVAGKKFSDVLAGLEQDIIRIITRKAITEPLGNAIAGSFGGSGSSNFLTSIFGSLFGGARAAGGPVNAGRAYLVGENGPELFAPRGNGDIMPAGRTARAMGGNTYNFTFALPSDSVDHRRTAQQVAREASRYMQLSGASV
jgi:hypothetical protein